MAAGWPGPGVDPPPVAGAEGRDAWREVEVGACFWEVGEVEGDVFGLEGEDVAANP